MAGEVDGVSAVFSFIIERAGAGDEVSDIGDVDCQVPTVLDALAAADADGIVVVFGIGRVDGDDEPLAQVWRSG